MLNHLAIKQQTKSFEIANKMAKKAKNVSPYLLEMTLRCSSCLSNVAKAQNPP